MNAICNVGIAPLRKTFAESAEMISQMLYGETCIILDESESFYQIRMDFDRYEGWVDKLQIQAKEASLSAKYTLRNNIILASNLHCVMGAEITVSFAEKHHLQSDDLLIKSTPYSRNKIILQANKYLNAPYLWGGRSPFGIDCSGFTQIVYKTCGISLLRDTSMQIKQGRPTDYRSCKDGDLAFFSKPGKTNVSHVGFVIRSSSEVNILHSSGWVKQEKFTNEGIINDDGALTHQLLEIRNVYD